MKINLNFKNNTSYSVDEYEEFTERLLLEAANHVNYQNDFEMTYIFVDDQEMQNINKTYRNKDKTTDVITFDISEDNYLADCFISIERAIEQAKLNQHSLKEEMAYLFTHSFLHAIGYDHEEDEVDCLMFDLQEEIINKFIKNEETI